MATVAKDTKVKTQKNFQYSSVPIDPLVAINQGDLVYWDSVLNIARPAITDTNAGTLIGVSDQTNPVASVTSSDRLNSINPEFGDEFIFKTTPGETYFYFDFLYLSGVDSQTVTKVPATNSIGHVVLASGQSSLVGSSTVTVRVFTRMPGSFVS